jgi:hypothetical protein
MIFKHDHFQISAKRQMVRGQARFLIKGNNRLPEPEMSGDKKNHFKSAQIQDRHTLLFEPMGYF